MAIMVGTGRGAGAGVLVKNAEALERLETVDTLVVDKTGTLTEGKPAARRAVAAIAPFTEDDVLRLAAALEQASEHPLAAAILAGARDRGIACPPASRFDVVPGRGVVGHGRRHARSLLATRRCSQERGVDVVAADDPAPTACVRDGADRHAARDRRRDRPD